MGVLGLLGRGWGRRVAVVRFAAAGVRALVAGKRRVALLFAGVALFAYRWSPVAVAAEVGLWLWRRRQAD
jgi:hypothetical protein